MTTDHAPIGAFLRPVGSLRFWFCYELVGATPGKHHSDLDTWHMRRWGLDEQREPCDDGGGHAIHYLPPLREVRPGVYRVGYRGWCDPVYFVQVLPRGQIPLRW